MCGIAGKVFLDQKEVALPDLKKMSDKIAHRGPDDEGFYISPDRKVGLVNRRLAIIDLSSKGHQPMSYKGRYFITFNGEIYNFRDLRTSLEKEQYRFKSRTDTEVILALYDRWGTKCLKYLRGMFAFAIYDAKEKTIFLARDRLGKKPLKYFFEKNVLIFASELKAILTQKEVEKTPDWNAVNNFLTFGYVPAPRTGFVGINKLEPGHFLFLDLKKKKITKERYWFLDFSEKMSLSEGEWIEKILNLVKEAVSLRTVSDVPLGVFLSGGVDSSVITAVLANLSKEKIKTFTIGFKQQGFSEVKYAERLAKLYQTEHTVMIAEPSSVEILSQLARQFEEPFADSSNIITYMVSKLARKEVKVILNGDGGDENFAGYDRYFRLERDAALEPYLFFLRTFGIPLSTILRKERIKRFLEKSKLPFSHRYVTYNCFLLNEDKKEIFTSRFKHLTMENNSYQKMEEKFFESKLHNLEDAALYADISMYLPDDLLAKMDIASMAVSLEVRSPLLDHNLVELAAKIPFSLKVKGKTLKYILKRAAERVVPKENLYRPKMGFSIPLAYWFSGELKKFTRSSLLSKKAKSEGLFKRDIVEKMLAGHTPENDLSAKLWALLTLELWLKEYFD